jgi:hypothetical protein
LQASPKGLTDRVSPIRCRNPKFQRRQQAIAQGTTQSQDTDQGTAAARRQGPRLPHPNPKPFGPKIAGFGRHPAVAQPRNPPLNSETRASQLYSTRAEGARLPRARPKNPRNPKLSFLCPLTHSAPSSTTTATRHGAKARTISSRRDGRETRVFAALARTWSWAASSSSSSRGRLRTKRSGVASPASTPSQLVLTERESERDRENFRVFFFFRRILI